MCRLAATAAFSLALAGGAQAAVLVNGSFEQPAGGPIRQGLNDGDTFVTGWTNHDGFQIYESDDQDGIDASDGAYYVSFGHSGATGGSLSQILATDLGVHYTVSYDIRLQQGSDTGSGFLVSASTGDSVSSGDAVLDNWTSGAVLTFTGTGGNVTLTFKDATTSGGNSNLALDNVRLASDAIAPPSGAPEPTSWALMILGFGGTGFVARRRRTLHAA